MPSDADDAACDEDDGSTKSTSKRYKYTNDLIAGFLVVFAALLTASYVYQGTEIPIWLATTDALAVTTAVVWAFGRGAFSKAAEAFGGTNEN